VNWRELARQSGAHDRRGLRAGSTFCFTEQELGAYTAMILVNCMQVVQIEATLPRTADTTLTADLERVAALQAVFRSLENLMDPPV